MGIRITEKPELGRLVSPHGNRHIPIHNWFPYKHGYSRNLAAYLLNSFGLSPGNWVLDPFCGSGTTLLTCKELGINARGYDVLPFSVFLSNVKVSDYDMREVERQLNALVKVNSEPRGLHLGELPDIPLVKKAFGPEMEKRLLRLKHDIDGIRSQNVRSLLTLGFLNILESVSNTSKNGGFLRIVQRNVSPDVVGGMFVDQVKLMVRDLADVEKRKRYVKLNVAAKTGDARRLPTRMKYDAIISSPPYPNRHDYTRIYSLEMVFGFVSSNDELKKVRYNTLRSHVEARRAASMCSSLRIMTKTTVVVHKRFN